MIGTPLVAQKHLYICAAMKLVIIVLLDKEKYIYWQMLHKGQKLNVHVLYFDKQDTSYRNSV